MTANNANPPLEAAGNGTPGWKRSLKWIILVLAMIAPWAPFANEYIIRVGILMCLYMLLSLGLNVVPGMNGLLELGYVAFYGVGAYTAGLLTVHFGLSFWLCIPAAALVAALLAVLRGLPTLRLTGDYFAIVTFGFGELIYLFLNNELWLTRGPRGLPGIDPPSINLEPFGGEVFWIEGNSIAVFYLALFLVVATVYILERISDSRLGRAWFAIRDDEMAAISCGINLNVYKSIGFAVSAAIGAVAGAFYARWTMVITPEVFVFWESFLVLAMVVLGGMGNIYGVMVGAAAMVALGEILRTALPALGMPENTRFLFYGAIMVLVMRFRPAGLLPIQAVAAKMKSNRKKRTRPKIRGLAK